MEPFKQKITAGIITASDKGYQGQREDVSGILVSEILKKHDFEVLDYKLLPDDKSMLSNALIAMCKKGIDLIITTGGTGFSPRDITPEATLCVIERNAPGIAEAMRYNSLKITPRAMLSRGVAGIRDKTLIVNLPGSPKAVKENLEYIITNLGHGIEILKGTAFDCAAPSK
ncbi:MogA/MoaB family molybdenum cofactor biosynthesis protein [Clostridium lacusfryxellense]|uniref:MogA/MoaB family molybdenum cofactor biosynthesis protein n=1 Tax=Clostridium lacusfryxellense TaxID=205328 RepID=UPI001C0B2DE9|nr:MogA/MoaB family molybdenum cofactor biosynthesis protein [Clostridium lacusfryxellense]MBU3112618.1 MogA/MoaB family molybdenum cofactor biosynthesis protein [Clostridium lacusfryxellense]